MSILTIDQSKCKKDGVCMAECPFNLIVAREEDGLPEIRPAAAKLCIACGHCVAVCPHKALSLGNIGPESCELLGNGALPTIKKAGLLMKSRRSIRTYTKDRVERATVEQILDICRWAPSAKNSQPVRWLIVEDPAAVQQLAGLTVEWLRTTGNYPGIVAAWDAGRDMVLRGAPMLAVAHADSRGFKPDTDCTIALTYFELAASTLGLGTCWAGILMSAAASGYPPLAEALALPEGHKLYGAMMVGHPKYHYLRIPPRKKAAVTWRS